MPISYSIIRSSRKTVSLEIRSDGTVLVRAPRRLSEKTIREFVQSKEGWLREKLKKYENRPALPAFTESQMETLKKQAKADITARVRRFAPLVGVSYGRITIRAQKTRWGSCSGEGNLNFNCLLVLTPPEIRDYVARYLADYTETCRILRDLLAAARESSNDLLGLTGLMGRLEQLYLQALETLDSGLRVKDLTNPVYAEGVDGLELWSRPLVYRKVAASGLELPVFGME
jgi:hypothetical protein